MSHTALITFLSIVLLAGNLLGGGSKPPSPTSIDSPPAVQADVEQSGVVRAGTVAVYEDPASRNVLARLLQDDEVTILKRQDDWYQIRVANGQIGYVNTFAVSPNATSPPIDYSKPFDVVAYYLTDSRRPAMPSLTENIDLISTVIPWMWQLTETGDIVDDFSVRDVAQALTITGAQGRRGVALVHNLPDKQFDGDLAHRLLSSPEAKEHAVQNLLDQLRRWDLSGIHIDFENVMAQDRQHLNRFMQHLYEVLKPEGFYVSIALPAKTYDDKFDNWSGGYDYTTLSRYVDHMMIMAYDEHWRGGHPGPVASIGWVERVVRYALSAGVPSEKIILGIPGYGYDWPVNGSAGHSVTYSEAMALASEYNVDVMWDDVAKAPYFRYRDREVWFENRSSFTHKIDLVQQYELGGISLWRLGQEDPGIWSVLRRRFSG